MAAIHFGRKIFLVAFVTSYFQNLKAKLISTYHLFFEFKAHVKNIYDELRCFCFYLYYFFFFFFITPLFSSVYGIIILISERQPGIVCGGAAVFYFPFGLFLNHVQISFFPLRTLIRTN